MMKPSILAALLLPLAFGVIFSPQAQAQGQVDTNSPIVVKQSRPRPIWLAGNVVRADGNAIVISELGNPRMVHTFTYSGKSLEKMTTILNAGGYQAGDKVKVLYQPGDTVALDLRGKPSKSP